MLKRTALALAFGLLAASGARAAINHDSSGVTDQVYVNPLGLAYGLGGVGWEHAFDHDNSLALEGSFRGSAGSNYNYYAAGLNANYRWYLGADHSRLRGPYVGPKLYLLNYGFNYDQVQGNGNVERRNASNFFVGGGVQGGYQWLFEGGLTLGVGGEVYFLGGNLDLGAGSPSVGGVVGANGGLVGSVGYAF
jgi:hypothetical protein